MRKNKKMKQEKKNKEKEKNRKSLMENHFVCALASVSLALPASRPPSVVTVVRGTAALIFAADVALFHSAPRGRMGGWKRTFLKVTN